MLAIGLKKGTKQKTIAESDGFCGEGGIRTRGTELPVRQFSKLLISATHPPHPLLIFIAPFERGDKNKDLNRFKCKETGEF